MAKQKHSYRCTYLTYERFPGQFSTVPACDCGADLANARSEISRLQGLVEDAARYIENATGDTEIAGSLRGQADERFNVIINAKPHTLGGPRAYYGVILSRAFDAGDIADDVVYTVTYCNGPEANREGIMDGCQSLELRDGMVFSVTDTGRA